MAKVNIDGPEKDVTNDEQQNTALEPEAKGAEDGTDIKTDGEPATEENKETDDDKKHQNFFNKKRQKEVSKREKDLEEEVAKLTGDLADEKNRYLRLLADFDNFKKRTSRENETRYLDSKADALKQFLPVVDAFERALKTEVPVESKQFTSGYEMIYDIFLKILKDNGVEEIKALGEPFDPNLHNAVMHVEDENEGANVVVEVFEKGYRMGDRILRYSIVKVAN